MKKVCVVTATRAEYGLLKNTIYQIQESPMLELCLVVTGAHLSATSGYTVKEIEDDGIPISAKIDMGVDSDVPREIVISMSKELKCFAEFFSKEKPDMVVVLGDRYELLPICNAALVMGIPIAHISGGEITEGAIDDSIRHCITKMSNLHFPGCEDYRQRIIQLGERPDTVFNYGDVGIESIVNTPLMTLEELETEIGVKLNNHIMMTFHPLTTKPEEIENQITEVLSAIECFKDNTFIITQANADAGGQTINCILKEFVAKNDNCYLFASLGIRKYINALRHAKAIIGNSSSGIVEAPVLKVPTVNIGDRQKGRLLASSVRCCDVRKEAIVSSIKWALSEPGRVAAMETQSPYQSGETSKLIVKEIERYLYSDKCRAPKVFYDLPIPAGGWGE